MPLEDVGLDSRTNTATVGRRIRSVLRGFSIGARRAAHCLERDKNFSVAQWMCQMSTNTPTANFKYRSRQGKRFRLSNASAKGNTSISCNYCLVVSRGWHYSEYTYT